MDNNDLFDTDNVHVEPVSGDSEVVPILPLSSTILFPGLVSNVQVEVRRHEGLIRSLKDGGRIGLLLAKSNEGERQNVGGLYRIGTIARVLSQMQVNEDIVNVYLQSADRMMVEHFVSWEPYITAQVQSLHSGEYPEDSLEPLRERVLASLEQFVSLAPRVPDETARMIMMNARTSGAIADMVAIHIPFELRDRQQVLEAIDIEHRLNIVLEMLDREIANISVMSEISSIARKELDSAQRKMFLKRQLRTIQKELGEDPEQARLEQLRGRIDGSDMPDHARRKAESELERLAAMSASSSEYNVILGYLDWLLDLPWGRQTSDRLNLQEAREELDRHHFGLDDVKERILEFLAVRYLKKEIRGPVLCLSGPPGVGKTSLGRSIASALGRGFVRMSVGGMRDESEIRGHRRTYVGAMPGRIVQQLRQAGTENPVFMIDEIDKMGSDFRGDPSSALLEVLDPEQNSDFLDHYLDIPIDLSSIFFIATANVLPNIPAALRDRLEVIKLPGYTEAEKLSIARKHLLPRQKRENGLSSGDLKISDPGLERIIRSYTREAGVRNLARELANVCRKTAKELVSGKPGPHTVDYEDVPVLLGAERFTRESSAREDATGVSTALAWSEFGGEILFVEAVRTPGTGHIRVTGTIGDVMRESANAAYSYAISNAEKLGIDPTQLSGSDIHVHIPAGAIPKDGPSAGLALVSAVVSLLTGRLVDHTVAMTGEITLTGRVLPIGGLKEKVIAAHRAGITTVLVPQKNAANIEELPEELRKDLKIIPVSRITEALEHVLT